MNQSVGILEPSRPRSTNSIQVYTNRRKLKENIQKSTDIIPAEMEVVKQCDACGAALDGRRVEGMGGVSLLQCDCGLVITSPRPAPDELGQYYPPTYYSYLPKAPTRSRQILAKLRSYKCGYPSEDGLVAGTLWRAAALLFGNLFLFYLPYRGPGKNLLEVGCGTGSDRKSVV